MAAFGASVLRRTADFEEMFSVIEGEDQGLTFRDASVLRVSGTANIPAMRRTIPQRFTASGTGSACAQ